MALNEVFESRDLWICAIRLANSTNLHHISLLDLLLQVSFIWETGVSISFLYYIGSCSNCNFDCHLDIVKLFLVSYKPDKEIRFAKKKLPSVSSVFTWPNSERPLQFSFWTKFKLSTKETCVTALRDVHYLSTHPIPSFDLLEEYPL